MALGGSTNAVLHLLAIANEAEVDLTLEDFNRIGAKVPLLGDLKPFGKFVMQHDAFRSGNFDTHFVGNFFSPEKLQHTDEKEAMAAAYAMAKLMQDAKSASVQHSVAQPNSNWKKNRTTEYFNQKS